MSEIRTLRRTVGVTQAALADAAGTSQPTITAYETGRKSPTLGTVRRLAESVGLAMSVQFHPPLTREDRRSIWLYRSIVLRLEERPNWVLKRAQETLKKMRHANPGARQLLDEWGVLLKRSIPKAAEGSGRFSVHASARAQRLSGGSASVTSAVTRVTIEGTPGAAAPAEPPTLKGTWLDPTKDAPFAWRFHSALDHEDLGSWELWQEYGILRSNHRLFPDGAGRWYLVGDSRTPSPLWIQLRADSIDVAAPGDEFRPFMVLVREES